MNDSIKWQPPPVTLKVERFVPDKEFEQKALEAKAKREELRQQAKEARKWLKRERFRESKQGQQKHVVTEFELEDFFMEAAERILDPTVFANILHHARKDHKAHLQRLTEQRISRFNAIRDD